MEKKRGLLKRIKAGIDIPEGILSSQTMVELLGQGQVKIIQHKGIREYRDTCICIMTKKGAITVSGSGLEIVMMNRERIVISGRIDALELSGGGKE